MILSSKLQQFDCVDWRSVVDWSVESMPLVAELDSLVVKLVVLILIILVDDVEFVIVIKGNVVVEGLSVVGYDVVSDKVWESI